KEKVEANSEKSTKTEKPVAKKGGKRKVEEKNDTKPTESKRQKAASKKPEKKDANLKESAPEEIKTKVEEDEDKLQSPENETKEVEQDNKKTSKKTATKTAKGKKAVKNSNEVQGTDSKSVIDSAPIPEIIDCTRQSANGDNWNVKICSWNVDGIRAWAEKKGVDFLKIENPDIICLQETRCPLDKLPNLDLPGYHLYCKPGDILMPNVIIDRIAVAEYNSFYLVCVYVPNAGRGLVTLPKRLKWNEAFAEYIKKLDNKKPVIICGDMNVAHNEIDLTNPKTNKKNAGFTLEERQGMTDFLSLGFIDTFRNLYPNQKDAYTFWSYMKNARSKNIGWRLDYFLVSERLGKHICDSVIRSKVMGSDHCPITLFMYDRSWPEQFKMEVEQ
ncbi:DNA-(apurinic or apyrimidinic site) lyase-like, partial [Ctenocephalides felis]|uniref:DNA-(apurinic or apyrimidinic site) lyase-like n=1 Tax=Ctenocephalides felis TaxID=7515 RepID=UPI000E6E37D6